MRVMPGIRRRDAGRQNDDDHAVCVQRIADSLLDDRAHVNIDVLLDALTAIYGDCDYPVLRRQRNIELFLDRFESTIDAVADSRMKHCDFDMIKVIGRGAFGEVQLVRHKRTNTVYAMKCLSKTEMVTFEVFHIVGTPDIKRATSAFFWEERDIMAFANSEWLAQLQYAFQDSRFLYMVMEYLPGGDLATVMTANDEVPESWVRFYTAEVVLAIDALHSFGYIHRDVKPDNMLIARDGHLKLTDFGTCVRMQKDGKIRFSMAVGTPDYIPPEVLQSQGSEGVYGREIDWWSVGIFLYELLYGQTPFYSDSLSTTYSKITGFEQSLTFPSNSTVSSEAKDLMRRFLSNAQTRLGRDGSAEIKQHSFFSNSEWTFDSIRHATPPFVPQLQGDADTTYFDEISEVQPDPADALGTPRAFAGNQLPFIGFTYAKDCSPMQRIRDRLANGDALSTTPSTAPTVFTPPCEGCGCFTTTSQQLQSQLNAAESRVKEYERALEVMRQEKETLRQMIEEESALKEQTLGQLTTQTVEVSRAPDKCKQQIDDQEQELQTVKDQCRQLETRSEELVKQCAQERIKYREELEAKQAEVDRLRECVAERDANVRRLQMKREKAENAKREYTARVERLQCENEVLLKQVNKERLLKEQAIDKLASVVEETGVPGAMPPSKRERKEVQRSREHVENKRLEQQNRQLRQQIDQLVNQHLVEVQDMQALLREEGEEKMHLQTRIEDLQREVNRLVALHSDDTEKTLLSPRSPVVIATYKRADG